MVFVLGKLGLAASIAGFVLNTPAYAGSIKHVFVIAMENRDAKVIYNDPVRAPFIHGGLLPKSARADNFIDELPGLDSEPHYIWMEAGTNSFPDHTFKSDADPVASHGANATKSGDHLVRQMEAAGVSWTTYQEGLDPHWTGACPVTSSSHTFYAAKHNPFVFFKDIAGDPPSKSAAKCISHTKPYNSLAADMSSGTVSSYVFITPNLCNDMHGAPGCIKGHPIKRGDNWLRASLPPIIDWAGKNNGIIFITWDEGSGTDKIPFIAIGPGVKPGYAGHAVYNHGSMLKSIEEIFGLPILASVQPDSDLSDLFKTGSFP
ncbi:alkaline phosphatase family protein [Mesorhizobium sp. CA6]|uniref:alkaline phosphatase family protein n=1 Tax=Mesorhizobium sp. CA6 TaxID=588500 RepID=UPI001CC90FF0|nr:alkaline phosphatase family protein [Mesorhizobium sp. CA6]MBZ9765520.1 alkaline phosphatase family protein [Mesorhizobium sp. CA6]